MFESSRRWSFSASAFIAIGVLLLFGAALAPRTWFGAGPWTEADALAHQQAAADSHRLSFEVQRNPQLARELRDSTATLADLEDRLRRSAGAADRRRTAMRWAGSACCLLGAVSALIARSRGG